MIKNRKKKNHHMQDLADAPPAEIAEILVTGANKNGVAFDYSPESLSAADEFLADLSGRNPMAQAAVGHCVGCYYGEVLRRNLGGEWTKTKSKWRDITPDKWVLEIKTTGDECVLLTPINSTWRALQEADKPNLVTQYKIVVAGLETVNSGIEPDKYGEAFNAKVEPLGCHLNIWTKEEIVDGHQAA
jgi:hypothetical protein